MNKGSFRFAGQRKDEVVLLVARRHPVVLLYPGYKMVGIALIPWLVFVFSAGFTSWFGWTLLLDTLLLIWLGFSNYYSWTNSIYVLTNHRVIATDQRTILNRVVSEIPYEKIQEVSHQVKGMYHTMLNVGDVYVKTASGMQLALTDVYLPYELEQKIAQQMR